MIGNTAWFIVLEILYAVIVFVVCMRIIYDTRSISKTLAYLLLTIFVPIVGIIFYFSFGINYRKRKLYNKKISSDEQLKNQLILKSYESSYSSLNMNHRFSLEKNLSMIRLLSNRRMENEIVLLNNQVRVIQNGEELFPDILQSLKKARHHIHLEYYIYENDNTGNELKELLIKKAKEGVEVRFIYDDFGSRGIRKNIVRELAANGVKVFPFNKVKLVALANRLNYRNHRKILIVDGETSFIGGINISDRYNNEYIEKNGGYWRDTHLKIEGQSTSALQEIFLADWNFCSNETVPPVKEYFPLIPITAPYPKFVQIIASGPDSELPSILYSVIHAISKAEKEILLTTPYYIPESSLQEMLIIAALSGVDVRLLVPGKSDTGIVDFAAQSYFTNLLKAGVRVYTYQKGMIHSKTFVIDRRIASVGSANMDLRSFDLNFEVSSIIYDEDTAEELAEVFEQDLQFAQEINAEEWKKRPRWKKMTEKIIRLVSPFL